MPGASAGKIGSHLPPYEKFVLGRIVFAICERVSSISDTFSGWLLAGLGAAVTLIVSSEGTISDRLSSNRIDWILLLFAASSVAAFLAKRQAVYVARVVGTIEALNAAFADHEQQEEKLGVSLPLPPLHLFKRIMLDAVPRPLRAYVERKVEAAGDDILEGARQCARRAYLQGCLTFTQALLFVMAVGVVVWPSG